MCFKVQLTISRICRVERQRLDALKAERSERDAEFAEYFQQELSQLREQFVDNSQRSSKAEITAE